MNLKSYSTKNYNIFPFLRGSNPLKVLATYCTNSYSEFSFSTKNI